MSTMFWVVQNGLATPPQVHTLHHMTEFYFLTTVNTQAKSFSLIYLLAYCLSPVTYPAGAPRGAGVSPHAPGLSHVHHFIPKPATVPGHSNIYRYLLNE